MRNKFLAILALGMAATAALQGVAGAQSSVDPTNGAYSTGISGIQSFITGTAAGPLFVLAAAVVAIGVGLKWLKKGKTAAS